ncbi:peptidylprolyl isomerase fpr3 [Coemansia sp. RSA 1365]|nr:peptidylprolyl isomerase fpr3 [Coemansia sp. RSA 1365]
MSMTMFRGFWGLALVPGKSYSQTVDASFRLSNAALGTDISGNTRTSVVVTVDEHKFVLCSLTPSKIEQQSLDIIFTEGEEVTFEVQGDNTIHLTGNFIAELSEDSDEESDDDDIDLSQLTPEELQEMIDEGLIDPDKLLEDSDEDYDSEDAEADERIREITSEDEADMIEEAEEEPELVSIKEVKIKKQAEKKRKVAEDAAKPVEEPAKSKKSKKEKIKKEGSGAGAKKGARVGMYYIGKLTNGKVFDQNTKGKPFWFRLGAGEVIKGWDVGIIGMNKGAERRLTIPASMAYGKRGAPPDIPPNSTLVFDIRLVDFK